MYKKIKLIILVVLIAIISFLLGCTNNPIENESLISISNSESTLSDLSLESQIESQNFIVPEWTMSYLSILKEYKKFADCEIIDDDKNGTFFDNNIFSEPDINLAGHWGNMLNEAKLASVQRFPTMREAFGYSLKDLNGDGDDELILLLKDYTILAIFSTMEGKPKLLDAYWSRYKCALDSQGKVYTLSSGGTAGSYGTYVISNDGYGLKLIEEFEYDDMRFYKKTDTDYRQINETEFNESIKNNPISSINFKVENETKITKNSGIKFIPLFEE